MSFFGSVGKIFRKVVKTTSRVAPVALAVGAVAFTAGAALGLPGLAGGGWGGAVAKGMGGLGLDVNGGIGRLLTGVVTQAGYGAALGAGTALVSGGDVVRGSQIGAAAGGVGGGLLAAAGGPTDLMPKLGADGTPAGGPAPGGLAKNLYPNTPADGPVFANTDRSANLSTGRPAAAATTGLMSDSWWNSRLAGGVAQGLGTGLVAYGTAAKKDDPGLAQIYAERDRQAGVRANYGGVGPGLLARPAADQTPRPGPTERFDPANYGQGGQWVYDPSIGRIRFVPGPVA